MTLLTPEVVEMLMTTHNIKRFDELNKYAERLVAPRLLGTEDRRIISQVMRTHVIAEAVAERNQSDNGHRGICLFTAYTEDYTIGKLVDTVNRSYANRHGYHYINHTLTYEEMLLSIGPHKKHCTWYKVLLINQLLNDMVVLQQHKIQYIMWIDADALVINPEVRVEDIIKRGGDRDLIVAENMHAGCLINAGVSVNTSTLVVLFPFSSTPLLSPPSPPPPTHTHSQKHSSSLVIHILSFSTCRCVVNSCIRMESSIVARSMGL